MLKVSPYKEHVTLIEYPDDKKIYLIGTAHVSKKSIELAKDVITQLTPDTIALELDQKRYDVMVDPKRFEDTDIIKIIKKRQFLFFLTTLLLSNYQREIAEKLGVEPGGEFKESIQLAKNKNISIKNIDRPVEVTLKRTWRKSKWKDKFSIFNAFIGGALLGDNESLKQINESQIEELKDQANFRNIFIEMAEHFPSIKKTIIDERDIYMAFHLDNIEEKTTVAIVGMGHVEGIIKHLKATVKPNKIENISQLPSSKKIWKIIPWCIPVIIIMAFFYGFFFGEKEATGVALFWWIIINGSLSALGCLIALAHPITILVAFIGAPITSLNPTIGVGLVTAFVQSLLKRPLVSDFQEVRSKKFRFKKWWKNRLTKVFLVFIFSSVGSAIGTFVAFPYIAKLFLF